MSKKRPIQVITTTTTTASPRNAVFSPSHPEEETEKVEDPARSAYAVGSVRRLRVEDFMTFDSMEVRPGSRLNLIIGPNGSGKSCLMCALVLGLTGTPKMLGRSDNLGAFVKHGKSSCWIEIELENSKDESDEMGNLVIRRVITKVSETKTTSKWYMGSALLHPAPLPVATEEAVAQHLKRLRVQVDNMCTFLPQDIVLNFSLQSPAQLLNDTIRAVLGTSVLEERLALERRQKTMRESESSLEAQRKELETLNALNEERARDVKRQDERKRLAEELEACNLALPHVEFLHTQTMAKELDGTIKALKEQDRASKAHFDPLRARESALRAELDLASERHERLRSSSKKTNAARAKAVDHLALVAGQLAEARSEAERARHGAAAAHATLVAEEAKLERAREELEAHHREHDVERDRKETEVLNRERIQCLSERNKADAELDESEASLSAKQRERGRIDAELQRLRRAPAATSKWSQDALSRLPKGNLYHEVLSVRSKLAVAPRAGLHGPLICEVYAPTAFLARVLDDFVRPALWVYFFAETDAHQEELLRLANNRVSTLVCGDGSEAQSKDTSNDRPRVEASQLADLGLIGHLDALIHASGPGVLEGMRRLTNAHRVLVGSERTDAALRGADGRATAALQSILRASSCAKLTVYTPTQRLQVYASKYGNRDVVIEARPFDEETTRQRPSYVHVQAATASASAALESKAREEQLERFTQLETELHQTIETLTQQVHALRQTKAEHHRRVERCEAEMKRLQLPALEAKRLQVRVAEMERRVQRARDEREHTDWPAKQAEALKRVERAKQQLLGALESLAGLTAELQRLARDVAVAVVAKLACEAEKLHVSGLLTSLAATTSEVAERLSQAQLKLSSLVGILKKQNIARKAVVVPEHLHESYVAMRHLGLSELHVKIGVLSTSVAAIFEDPTLVAEYEERAARILTLTTAVESHAQIVTLTRDELALKVERWKQPVVSMMERIHAEYETMFRTVAAAGYTCAGKVTLEGEDESISSFGVGIHVKFRDDQELTRLSGTVQSGGERALSTFLYFLALQSVSKAGCRMIDEMNQGMDPDKERVALGELLRKCSRSVTPTGCPQYMIFTPKLLPDLELTPEVNVILVLNGFFNAPQEEWDLEGYVRRTAKRLKGEAEEEEEEE